MISVRQVITVNMQVNMQVKETTKLKKVKENKVLMNGKQYHRRGLSFLTYFCDHTFELDSLIFDIFLCLSCLPTLHFVFISVDNAP